MSTKKQKEKTTQKSTPNQIYQNINTQSTINSLKEILIPQIKETQAKQMIDIYERKYLNNKQNDINKTCSILDYSFVTGRENTKNDSNIKKKKSNQSFKSSNEDIIEKQNFYERQIEKEAEKEEKINLLKEKKEKEEQKHIQSKPIINKNSHIIINKSKTYQPIYKRINQIEYNQKQKIKQIQSMINKDLQYNNHRNNSRPISKDEFDKWLQMNQTWDKLRQAKINYLKNDIDSLKQKEEELEREEETFHPKINKNSSLILLQKNKNYLNQDVGERLYKTHFKYKNDIERKRNSSLPSFKPYINKHYEIKQEYYDYMNVEQKEIYDMLNVF